MNPSPTETPNTPTTPEPNPAKDAAKPRRLQVYESDDIVVTFAPNVCKHSGVCLRGLPTVFDIKHRRWVQPENAPAAAVAAQVARCPSGALQCQLKTKPAADPE